MRNESLDFQKLVTASEFRDKVIEFLSAFHAGCNGNMVSIKALADIAITAVFHTLTCILLNGNKYTVRGFGTFEVVKRNGRSPDKINEKGIKPYYAIKFRPSRSMKEIVKNGSLIAKKGEKENEEGTN